MNPPETLDAFIADQMEDPESARAWREAEERNAAAPPIRHSSDGRWGYESARCASGVDGCDDRACICLCHSRLGPYEQAPYGCPACRTILNARAAGSCPDLWHSDNRLEPTDA